MRALTIILVLLIQWQFIYAQTGLHGSYVVAAIGKDGIIMASDSRLVFFDTNDGPNAPNLAYYDSCSKIYEVGKFVVGFVGVAAIGNVFLGTMVNMYQKHMSANITIDEILPDFINYYLGVLPRSGKTQLSKLKVFAIGYKNNEPLICVAKNENNQWLINKNIGSAISSDRGTFVNSSSDSMSCQQLAILADHCINQYINETKNTSVGGLISVLQLTPDGKFKWIRNKPKPFLWATTTEFLKDYFSKKVVVHFFKPENRTRMEKLWREELK